VFIKEEDFRERELMEEEYAASTILKSAQITSKYASNLGEYFL